MNRQHPPVTPGEIAAMIVLVAVLAAVYLIRTGGF